MKNALIILLLLLATPVSAQVKMTMEDAIRLSREHSFSVKSSQHDSLAAVYDYRAARSGRFPSLSLNAASFYIDELQTVSLLPNRSIELGSHENYQADVRLNMPLYTGGRLSSQINIQRENLNIHAFSLETERLNIAYQARQAYLALIMAGHLVKSAEASLNRIRLIQKDVENLYAVGMADSVDILDASLAHQKGSLNLVEYQTNLHNSLLRLAQVTGLENKSEIVPSDEFPVPAENSAPDAAGRIIARPELKISDSRVRSSQHLIGLNRAALFPSLSGYVGYSAGKPNRDQFNAEWNDYFQAGLALNWEFNLGGKAVHSTRSARQTLFSSQMVQENLKEQLRLQADLAASNLSRSYQSFLIAGTELEIATSQYRLGQEKLKAGEISINRLLELEEELTSVEQAYQISIINYYQAQSDYFYAVGDSRIFGGF